jgi:type IV fimbrial biogenesis protein FimT
MPTDGLPAHGAPAGGIPPYGLQAHGAPTCGAPVPGAPAGRIRESGFTLVELVTVMLVVGILVVMGVPSFRYVTTSNRIASEVNALLGDMQYARSEAVKEGQPVTVCAAIVPATGVPPANCSGGSDWTTGWIVFSDLNGNQTVNAAAGDVILRVQPAFTGTDTFVGGANLDAATFNREGFASAYAGAATVTLPQTITLHSTPTVTAWTRCLALSFAGRPTTETAGMGNPAC